MRSDQEASNRMRKITCGNAVPVRRIVFESIRTQKVTDLGKSGSGRQLEIEVAEKKLQLPVFLLSDDRIHPLVLAVC